MMFNEAVEVYSDAAKSGGTVGDRDRYCYALALLNAQPRSTANIELAKRLFHDVAGRGAGAEIESAALYYLGRIEEIHAFTPDKARASESYAALYRIHPDSFFGQLAFLKHAALVIHRTDGGDRLARELQRLEAESTLLVTPFLRNNFHLLMAEAYYQNESGSEAKALDHLIAADKIGFKTGAIQADVLYKIGEIAERLGQVEVAREACERFLRDFPRDAHSRGLLVRLRLDQLRLHVLAR